MDIKNVNFPGALWLGFLGTLIAGIIDIILFIIDLFNKLANFFTSFTQIFNDPSTCIDAIPTPGLLEIFDYIGSVFDCLGNIIDFTPVNTAVNDLKTILVPSLSYITVRKRGIFGDNASPEFRTVYLLNQTDMNMNWTEREDNGQWHHRWNSTINSGGYSFKNRTAEMKRRQDLITILSRIEVETLSNENAATQQIYNSSQVELTYKQYFARKNITVGRNESYISKYYGMRNSSCLRSSRMRYRNDGNQRLHMFQSSIFQDCQCAKSLISFEEMILFEPTSFDYLSLKSCSCRYKVVDDFGVVSNKTLDLFKAVQSLIMSYVKTQMQNNTYIPQDGMCADIFTSTTMIDHSTDKFKGAKYAEYMWCVFGIKIGNYLYVYNPDRYSQNALIKDLPTVISTAAKIITDMYENGISGFIDDVIAANELSKELQNAESPASSSRKRSSTCGSDNGEVNDEQEKPDRGSDLLAVANYNYHVSNCDENHTSIVAIGDYGHHSISELQKQLALQYHTNNIYQKRALLNSKIAEQKRKREAKKREREQYSEYKFSYFSLMAATTYSALERDLQKTTMFSSPISYIFGQKRSISEDDHSSINSCPTCSTADNSNDETNTFTATSDSETAKSSFFNDLKLFYTKVKTLTTYYDSQYGHSMFDIFRSKARKRSLYDEPSTEQQKEPVYSADGRLLDKYDQNEMFQKYVASDTERFKSVAKMARLAIKTTRSNLKYSLQKLVQNPYVDSFKRFSKENRHLKQFNEKEILNHHNAKRSSSFVYDAFQTARFLYRYMPALHVDKFNCKAIRELENLSPLYMQQIKAKYVNSNSEPINKALEDEYRHDCDAMTAMMFKFETYKDHIVGDDEDRLIVDFIDMMKTEHQVIFSFFFFFSFIF